MPKPSKFVKGEMYYSDYESDLEGHIPCKWRSLSDNEDDVAATYYYRRVRPNLGPGRSDGNKVE